MDHGISIDSRFGFYTKVQWHAVPRLFTILLGYYLEAAMLSARRPLSVSVVDPDLSSRRAVAHLLLAHGYQAESFASQENYETYFATARPPLLLLIDARVWLAADTLWRKRVADAGMVVALGAQAKIEHVGPALACGCADFLVKPIVPGLLLEVLNEASGKAEGVAS